MLIGQFLISLFFLHYMLFLKTMLLLNPLNSFDRIVKYLAVNICIHVCWFWWDDIIIEIKSIIKIIVLIETLLFILVDWCVTFVICLCYARDPWANPTWFDDGFVYILIELGMALWDMCGIFFDLKKPALMKSIIFQNWNLCNYWSTQHIIQMIL